uniref:Bromodomain-containing protein n=1 Tax=Cucumis melo TaxID=3656 RepID=A0A9I9E330_CUCME
MQSTTSGKPRLLYRAALLRNRFADTILKAREKALEKGDKRDPEKVRMEREELERQQREGWRRATDGERLKLKLHPRQELCVGKTSYSQRLTLCVENSFFSRRLT